MDDRLRGMWYCAGTSPGVHRTGRWAPPGDVVTAVEFPCTTALRGAANMGIPAVGSTPDRAGMGLPPNDSASGSARRRHLHWRSLVDPGAATETRRLRCLNRTVRRRRRRDDRRADFRYPAFTSTPGAARLGVPWLRRGADGGPSLHGKNEVEIPCIIENIRCRAARLGAVLADDLPVRSSAQTLINSVRVVTAKLDQDALGIPGRPWRRRAGALQVDGSPAGVWC